MGGILTIAFFAVLIYFVFQLSDFKPILWLPKSIITDLSQRLVPTPGVVITQDVQLSNYLWKARFYDLLLQGTTLLVAGAGARHLFGGIRNHTTEEQENV